MIFSKGCSFAAPGGCKLWFMVVLTFVAGGARAQSSQGITEIITDYGGYFRSGNAAVNPIRPDTSHNLLAFTFNGIRYATGVNNTLLGNHGDGYINTVFRCLPINVIATTVNANTKIGLGAMYDGVFNGPSVPPPANNMQLYLTDGISGLNLGTGVANLPAGTMDFNVDTIRSVSIGDGIPDILITQIADPSAGIDQYSFLDAGNNIIGSQHGISFNGITPVANWVADFYEANTNPLVLTTGFTQTERPIRLWAADFSYFGITTSNYQHIKKFRIQLNGNSDIAFIAYNFTSTVILPVNISSFKSIASGRDVRLSWETQSEINASHFVIERSTNAVDFQQIRSVPANGHTNAVKTYDCRDLNLAPGTYYYRLKQVDNDGAYRYSQVLKELIAHSAFPEVFPNPVKDVILFAHPSPGSEATIHILSNDGKLVQVVKPLINAAQTRIDVSSLPAGNYFLRYANGREAGIVRSFLKL